MEFSKGQFEALIADLRSGLEEFSAHIEQVGPVAMAAANRWYVPADARDAIIWLANKTIEIGKDLIDLFIDLVKGATAPIFMFSDAWQWMDVRGAATGVASALSAQHLTVDDSDWSGRARDAYVSVANGQSAAAEKIGLGRLNMARLPHGHTAGTAARATSSSTTRRTVAARDRSVGRSSRHTHRSASLAPRTQKITAAGGN